jgi:hypothetical protein
MRALAFAVLLVGVGCDNGSEPLDLTASSADLASHVHDMDSKASNCASTFGNALGAGFGRFDGTLRAVVPPGDNDCAMPNSDHVIVEVDANGSTYRMVVNVLSDSDQPDVLSLTKSAPLSGIAFTPGWNANQLFDYVTTLGVHSTDFTSHSEANHVQNITDSLTIGADLSVFASSDGGASAHLVHRNATNTDGAIVVDPTGSPRYLLFAFSEQSF